LSFVPITGAARFRRGEPPRESSIEFSDERRVVSLPIRGALPVLSKAHADDATHPSVALLSGASLLGLRLVAAGRLAPGDGSWAAVLDPDDEDRITRLARARAYDAVDAATAEGIVRGVIDAVVDAMPRSAPTGSARVSRVSRPRPTGPKDGSRGDFTERLQRLIETRSRPLPDDRPQLVTISLRLEADDEELAGGACRLVLQVHDERNPLHVADAALLWTDSGPEASHGFGDRARTHATIALRAAADVWPVLDRFLDVRVPDQITLDGEELANLLEEGVGALEASGVPVLWPKSLGRELTSRTVLAPRHEDNPLMTGLFGPDAMFSFRWELALHGEPLTSEEMDRLAQAATPIIRLRDNWIVVDPTVARRARKRLVREVKPGQALAATLTGVVKVEEQEVPVVVGATLEKVRADLVSAATRPPIPTPTSLQAELRDYQRHGLTWLAQLTSLGLGACLADDMGLGKTVTLIALHLHRSSGPTLVVCPASLLGNWEAEIVRFAPGVPVRRFHGGRRDLTGLTSTGSECDPLTQPGAGFVLTTYGTMRRDHSTLAAVPWDLVVGDEAQHVKNPQSSTAKALRSIPSAARVALTGTPVENNLTELWAILDWAIPGLLGSRNAFRKVWAAPIESGVDPAKAHQFAELIAPFLLRRRKSDPGIAPELPAKTETDHLLGLTREQVVLYEALVRDSMDRIERADPDTRRGLVLTLLTGLKQICNHPAHYLKQVSPRLTSRSEKLDLLDELLGTVLAEDGAVLIFTQYVAMARLLESHLARSGVPHQFLHGGTPVREREAMVRHFQAGPERGGVPVFLLSLKAGGTGLNLTAADHVVHFDRWWNPAVEEQATDRAHRIGQTRPVQVHRLVTQGTIEEKIAELLARKRALADSVLARGETALTELGDAELRDLVTLRRW